MKIENEKKASLLDTLLRSGQVKSTKDQKDQAVEEKQGSAIRDRVELSSRKDEIERIKERVKATPAVRQDRVDAIKEALKTETYNVKGELVARSLIKNHLLDEIL
jgi:negative regulator of flagellin synthesis FlgM